MISPLAYVHPDAKLGNNVTVEPFASIAGDVVIGDDCWIGTGAVIHDGAASAKAAASTPPPRSRACPRTSSSRARSPRPRSATTTTSANT